MTNQPEFKIDFLYGHMEFKEPEYTLYRMSDGSGKLFGEFVTLSGDYNDLLCNAYLARMKVHLA